MINVTGLSPSPVMKLMNITSKKRRAFNLKHYVKSNEYFYYGKLAPIINIIVVLINILLITTLIKGKFRKSTHVIMVAIAIADCLTGLVSVPFNIYVYGYDGKTGYLTLEWCYVHHFMQMILPGVFHVASLHLTIGLAVERFIVVTFPLRANALCTVRNGIKLCVVIFVLSVCTQMDTYTQSKFRIVSHISKTSNKTMNACARSQIPAATQTENILRIVFVVLLPCFILIVFTILLIMKLKSVKKWRKRNFSCSDQRLRSIQSLERLDLAVILMVVFIVLIELSVWISLMLSHVYSIRITPSHAEQIAIGHVIFQGTSPINFIILCFLSENFRLMFKQLLCGYISTRGWHCFFNTGTKRNNMPSCRSEDNFLDTRF